MTPRPTGAAAWRSPVSLGLAGLVAATQLACALRSGNPATADPLPDIVNAAANVAAALIGLTVLWPRTRALGSMLAALNMVASMVTNYSVDGLAYFLKVLPFDLGALVLAVALCVLHYRELTRAFRQHSPNHFNEVRPPVRPPVRAEPLSEQEHQIINRWGKDD